VPDGNALLPTAPAADVITARERAIAAMADVANRRGGNRRAGERLEA
jgi:hypothetical protein